MQNLFKWDFLDEPLYRWFLFLIALSMFGIAWRFVLAHIKGT